MFSQVKFGNRIKHFIFLKLLNIVMILRLNKLFPWHFQILGWVMIPVGIFGVVLNPIAGIIFFILGLLFVLSHEGIEIDKNEKMFRKYNSLFFIKLGGWQKYDEFVKLYINPVRTSQKIYTRVNTTSAIKNCEYKAYLKQYDEEKIFLMGLKGKEKLVKHLVPLAEYLELEITDNSSFDL